jgi:arylsulfatase A-like enzyme
VVFESAYAVYPESIKGFFATMCSRDPAVDVAPEVLAAAPCASLARALKELGYRTALFHSGRFAYLGMQSIVDATGFDLAEDAGAIGGHVESSFGVDEPATVARMLSWIDRLEPGEPFFVTYLPIAGHHPYATTRPGPFAEAGERGAYKNAIHEADEAIAALLGGLRARGHGDDTLVVLYGDHGEAFGQHRGNFGHTLFAYDENVRVPIVIHMSPDPSGRLEGLRVMRAASLLDLTPTILDLLGLPADARHEGVSLLDPRPRLALFFTDYALGWLGLRDECWKYLYEIDSKRSHLFDVCQDPGETLNRSAAESARVAIYRDRLVRWSAARRSEFSK